MQIAANGLTIPVVQLGPDFLIPGAPATVPAGTSAELRIVIDNEMHSWKVILLDGIMPGRERTAIAISTSSTLEA